MKRKQTLAFGLLAAFLVVSASIPLGYAGITGGYMYVILPNVGCCHEDTGPTCWVDLSPPEEYWADCERCCQNGGNFYEYTNDRVGCGCCFMPGG